MKLAERCSSSFDSRTRSRGDTYHQSGRVSIVDVDGEIVEAQVIGSYGAPYEVMVDLEHDGDCILTASCDCPYYEGGNLCKHIWALLRAIDNSSLDFKFNGQSALYVVPDSENEFLEDDYDDSWDDGPSYETRLSPYERQRRERSRPETWREQLQSIRQGGETREENIQDVWERVSGKRREIWYLLDIAESLRDGRLTIDLFRRDTKKDGQLGKAHPFNRAPDSLRALSFDEDRRLLGQLGGALRNSPYAQSYYSHSNREYVSSDQHETLLPSLCATGRFCWRHTSDEPSADTKSLAWDDGPAYGFRMMMVPDDAKKQWLLRGLLHRNEETVPLSEPILVLRSGIAVFSDRLARLDAASEFAWVALLRNQNEISVPYADRLDFLGMLYGQETFPEIDLPEVCRLPVVKVAPRPVLRVHKPEGRHPSRQLYAEILFDYDGVVVKVTDTSARILSEESGQLVSRDRKRESELLLRLSTWHVRPERQRYHVPNADVSFLARRLDDIVTTLIKEEWIVEAEGLRIRQAGAFRGSVASGVDWFELDGQFDYGDGVVANLPELLEAARHGQDYVRLSDGSRGMLPEQWLGKFGMLAEMGESKDKKLRFGNSQAALLDALLAAQDNVAVDRKFSNLRKKLRSFRGIEARKQPRGFYGELREYQREGLGWLGFLESFSLGGCLADDMGLGKTIQVLAMFQQQRAAGKTSGPSLIVVPRSLVFNWIDEAARFSPRLTLRDYTGLKRAQHLEELERGDVLVTTYGTMRRDILKLKELTFDHIVLDEAQAIKNPNSQAAKAARLLNGRHRLALTGTPVENHLGELWSLFEFLNPGMLGRSTVFQKCWKNGQAEAGTIELLRTALAPFLLRRTKEQVLTELPKKTEQTLYCELDKQERKSYDQLRKYYRESLQKKIEDRGLKQSKIHVLEALLRLRQAACHRGLLDSKHADSSSAKLDALLEQVTEIVEEGHKALVFSQFTSLLAIVRGHLDKRGIVYEYLDGRTRKRQEKVRRFQEDPDCPLFLISLKAGGHGLNLTAADYVFILDPWWNPAVEAQAVDRVHRIGQERPVFAYRLIARDTVEEKILQLQESKRSLAESIISADGSLIQRLTAEDLQLLLG